MISGRDRKVPGSNSFSTLNLTLTQGNSLGLALPPSFILCKLCSYREAEVLEEITDAQLAVDTVDPR